MWAFGNFVVGMNVQESFFHLPRIPLMMLVKKYAEVSSTFGGGPRCRNYA